MCYVFDVAKYILHYCNENKIKDCSNKKLQKLLYYTQAWSLAFRNKPLFDSKIEAWLHGPVVSDIYHQYKEYKFSPITTDTHVDNSIFSEDDKRLMDAVLKYYAKYDADYLEMRTHIEEPWVMARNTKSEIITHKSMKDYYKSIIKKYASKQ